MNLTLNNYSISYHTTSLRARFTLIGDSLIGFESLAYIYIYIYMISINSRMNSIHVRIIPCKY